MASPAAAHLPGKLRLCPWVCVAMGALPTIHRQVAAHTVPVAQMVLKNTSRGPFLHETGLSVPLVHPRFIFMQRFQAQ